MADMIWRRHPLALAAENIAAKIGNPPAGCALVVCSLSKAFIAEAVICRLRRRMEAHLLRLDERVAFAIPGLARYLHDLAADHWGLVLLLSPRHAELLVQTVGRPDRGLYINGPHLFCDWLVRPQSLLRTYAVDMAELGRFRAELLRRLEGAALLHVTTTAGTDLYLRPRRWVCGHNDGEIFTAPIEPETRGVAVIDGCAYDGPPLEPFALCIRRGRVANLDSLDNSHQQAMLRHDLGRDENMPVVAEFGLGINPGARPDADLMEAEQSRGTCHIGFGHNLPFGGANRATYHLDLVMRCPTIEADGAIICCEGVYSP
ncbi:MAG: hypothetical protein H5T69_14020 [Chloroflexi bacterium]|nr:hypothetical protein [Chloroflexota bacterium]